MSKYSIYLKKTCLSFLFLITFPYSGIAQGYYSNNNSLMMLELMRAASAYDNKLAEVMTPVIHDIKDKYTNGQYNDCIDAVNFIFDKITFYKRNYYIYSWLYYYRGLSYLKLNYEEAGIANLVGAKDANNNEAYKELEQIFRSHLQEAINELENKYYSKCLYHINIAKSTSFYNYQLYEEEGKALEGMNNFNEARKSYRKAKKFGSPNAKTLMKQLKEHKKAYKKN